MRPDSYEEPVARILRFLKEEFSVTFNAFYDGDPDLIPDFNLPAVTVEKSNDTTSSGPTGLKRISEAILIKVILDKSKDWDAKDDRAELTMKRIRQLVEARDATSGKYLPESVKGALQSRLRLDGATIENDMTFELGTVPRPENIVTAEGHLTVNVTYFVPYV